MTPEEKAIIKELLISAKVVSNYNEKKYHIRTQAAWKRLKLAITKADKLLASNSTKKETK